MRTLLFALAASCLAAVPLAFAAPSESADAAGVREAVELYFRGHATGDGGYWRRAFHPESKLFWVKEGKLSSRTSEEFAAGATGQPAPDEAQRKRTILSVDVTGDAAIAKVQLAYPGKTFTDYLSLLKIDGTWRIVNKTFTVEMK